MSLHTKDSCYSFVHIVVVQLLCGNIRHIPIVERCNLRNIFCSSANISSFDARTHTERDGNAAMWMAWHFFGVPLALGCCWVPLTRMAHTASGNNFRLGLCKMASSLSGTIDVRFIEMICESMAFIHYRATSRTALHSFPLPHCHCIDAASLASAAKVNRSTQMHWTEAWRIYLSGCTSSWSESGTCWHQCCKTFSTSGPQLDVSIIYFSGCLASGLVRAGARCCKLCRKNIKNTSSCLVYALVSQHKVSSICPDVCWMKLGLTADAVPKRHDLNSSEHNYSSQIVCIFGHMACLITRSC